MFAGIIKKSVTRCTQLLFKISTIGLSSGKGITRYYMYEHLSQVFRSIKPYSAGNRALSISGSKDICALIGIENLQVIEADFPEYNMLKLPFKDGEFDWVVSGEVLEHVEGDPQQAIDESYRVLKPGGIAVHTTCFMYPIHLGPNDFWRFTPRALRLLCKKFSRIIDAGGWGNPNVWFIVGIGLKHYPVPHAKWHPLHKLAVKNNTKCPIVTWVVAQK